VAKVLKSGVWGNISDGNTLLTHLDFLTTQLDRPPVLTQHWLEIDGSGDVVVVVVVS